MMKARPVRLVASGYDVERLLNNIAQEEGAWEGPIFRVVSNPLAGEQSVEHGLLGYGAFGQFLQYMLAPFYAAFTDGFAQDVELERIHVRVSRRACLRFKFNLGDR